MPVPTRWSVMSNIQGFLSTQRMNASQNHQSYQCHEVTQGRQCQIYAHGLPFPLSPTYFIFCFDWQGNSCQKEGNKIKGKYTRKHVPSGVRNGQEINLRGNPGQGFNTPNLSESLKDWVLWQSYFLLCFFGLVHWDSSSWANFPVSNSVTTTFFFNISERQE